MNNKLMAMLVRMITMKTVIRGGGSVGGSMPSVRHVWTLGKSFTHSCLRRFGFLNSDTVSLL